MRPRTWPRGSRRPLPAGIRIVTSPSRRAHDTAAILAARARAGASSTIDERWLEADVGDAEGLTFDEVAARYPALAAQLAAGEAEIDWPGGETAAALRERVAAAWAAVLADRPPDGRRLARRDRSGSRMALATGGRPESRSPFPAPAEADPGRGRRTR